MHESGTNCTTACASGLLRSGTVHSVVSTLAKCSCSCGTCKWKMLLMVLRIALLLHVLIREQKRNLTIWSGGLGVKKHRPWVCEHLNDSPCLQSGISRHCGAGGRINCGDGGSREPAGLSWCLQQLRDAGPRWMRRHCAHDPSNLVSRPLVATLWNATYHGSKCVTKLNTANTASRISVASIDQQELTF